jgi:hypothetical protein
MHGDEKILAEMGRDTWRWGDTHGDEETHVEMRMEIRRYQRR